MKKLIITLISVLMAVSLFTACSCAGEDKASGGNSQGETTAAEVTSEADTDETLKVIETTADGGTVEEDSDGNIVTKDRDGKVTSVTDKDGKPVKVKDYLKAHPEAEQGSDKNKSADSTAASKASNSADEKVEESIPETVVEIQDDEDEVIDLSDI